MQSKLVISLNKIALSYPMNNINGLSSFLSPNEYYWPLKQISFDVYRGETLGIIGKNGAGKSSLLRLLAGIFKPDKGEIINYGVKINLLTLQLGFVNELTGRQNIFLSGSLMGLRKKHIIQNLDKIITFSELETFIDQPLSMYSTGMRARLGFSIALYNTADVILLDEVLGVGDHQFMEKSKNAMDEFIRSQRTVVLVSHNPATIKDLCDRVIWIENGVVVSIGHPAEILPQYHADNKNPAKTALIA